jgi:hypothetical protein
MTKSSNKKAKPLKLTPTLVVGIIIALIGCAGTIVAAIIGTVPVYLSLKAAQSAKEPTVTTLPQSTFTATADSVRWQDLLSITRDSICFATYVPDYLFEGQEKTDWLKNKYAPLYDNEELAYAPLIFEGNTENSTRISYTITNAASDNSWIRISKDISVSIRYMDDAPPTADVTVPSQCGASGEYRYFPATQLKTDYPEYSVNISANDPADYYKLEPGEFEVFVLNFECSAPGLYAVEVNLPVNYQGQDGTVTYSSTPGVFCPRNVTTYNWFPATESNIQIVSVDHFEWSGSVYEPVRP